MKLVVANRCLSWDPDTEEDWIPNPYWATAPIELVQLPEVLGNQITPPVTGPYRFFAKDREKAEQYASDQNWDELRKLAVPEMIPPTK